MEARLLLGRQHAELGAGVVEVLAEGASAIAISAGADPRVAARKAAGQVNEDAALLQDDGQRAFFGVADGHYGDGASHTLIERIALRWADWPATAARWQAFLLSLCDPLPDLPVACASTLLLAELDRPRAQLRAVSCGDSSLWLLAPGREPQKLTEPNKTYVSPGRPASFAAWTPQPIFARVAPGSLVLAFTDGVNECCYGRPEQSIQTEHLAALYSRHASDAGGYASALLRRALRGVAPHPGGQDNIALVAAAARGYSRSQR